jgi:hypothetical protein
MAQMKNLDNPLIVVYAVVDQERAMHQLPNSRPFVDDTAHAGKARE